MVKAAENAVAVIRAVRVKAVKTNSPNKRNSKIIINRKIPTSPTMATGRSRILISSKNPKSPKTTGAGKDLTAFRIGVKVKHPKFGDGTIIAVRGAGSNMIVDIAFEGGIGIKQLSASLAPLTIL